MPRQAIRVCQAGSCRYAIGPSWFGTTQSNWNLSFRTLGSPSGRAGTPQGVTERAKAAKQPSPPTEYENSVGTSPKGGGKAASPRRSDKLKFDHCRNDTERVWAGAKPSAPSTHCLRRLAAKVEFDHCRNDTERVWAGGIPSAPSTNCPRALPAKVEFDRRGDL